MLADTASGFTYEQSGIMAPVPEDGKGSIHMRHAGTVVLTNLTGLLYQIRMRQGLKEKKKLGIFYRKSKSFLHFHEDALGVFADLGAGSDFNRYPVNTSEECEALLSALDQALSH
jgi:hypothetical protein